MKYGLLLVILFLTGIVCAQHHEQETRSAAEAEHAFKRHRLMAVLSHTHVPEGINQEGEKAWLILGSLGLDYDFRINARWGVGLHSDLILENFALETHDEVEVERSRPLALVLAGSYRAGEHLALVAGVGKEFSKEEDYTIVRFGLDYGWELPDAWEVALSLMTDLKVEAYNAWVFGVGIGKYF